MQGYRKVDTIYSMQNPVRKFSTAKLPKISLKEFSGDPLEWTAFWDSFRSAVYDNSDILNVDKMYY